MSRSRGYGAARALVHLLLALLAGYSAAAMAQGPTVWALGDSLTAGFGLPPDQGFTAQLQAALRRDGVAATVRNGGVSGDTAAQSQARLLWGLRGLGITPDLAIVELGANDMLRGLPPQAAEAHLDAILAEFQRRHIPVLLAGMKAAPNLGPAYRQAFDAIYPRLARKYHATLYPFFLEGVTGHADLVQADGMHANARGVAVIVRGILPDVERGLRPRPLPSRR